MAPSPNLPDSRTARVRPTVNPLDLLTQSQLPDAEGISNCRLFGICRSLSRHRSVGTHTECCLPQRSDWAQPCEYSWSWCSPSIETTKYFMRPKEFMRGSLALELRPDGATRYGETTPRQPL